MRSVRAVPALLLFVSTRLLGSGPVVTVNDCPFVVPGSCGGPDYPCPQIAIDILVDRIDVLPGATYTVPYAITGPATPCEYPDPAKVYTAPSQETIDEVRFRTVGYRDAICPNGTPCKYYFAASDAIPFLVRYPMKADFLYGAPAPYGVPVAGEPTNFTRYNCLGIPDTFNWTFGDGGTASGTSTTHTFTEPGTFQVTLNISSVWGGAAGVTKSVVVRSVAEFTFAPEAPTAGQLVQFTDTSLPYEGPTTYSWSFGNGQTSPQRNPSTTYAAAGTYDVTLTITRGSKVYTRTKSVTVTAPSQRPDFDWSPESPVVGQPVTFRDLTPDLPGVRYWLYGDGISETGPSTPTHAYTTPGQKLVSLRIGSSDFTAKGLNVRAEAPKASFGYSPAAPKAGQAVDFLDRSTGDPTSWSWSFDDGTTSTERNPSHTFTSARVFYVTLTATSADGSGTVTVPVPVDPNVDFGFAPAAPQLKQPVQFTDQSVGLTPPIVYSWSFGDGESSPQQSPVHVYQTRGSFDVVFTATGAQGGGTATKTIVVDPTIVAKFTYAPSTRILPRQVVTFTDASTGGPESWSWSFGDGKSSALQSPMHEYEKKGSYPVTLTIRKGDETSSASLPLTVDAIAPRPSFIYAPSTPHVGDTIVFTDTSQDEPTSWEWRVDGVVLSTASTLSYRPALPSTVAVKLTVGNEAGAASASEQVKVLPKVEELTVNVVSKYGPCFIDGIPIQAPIDVKVVDWKGTPSSMKYTLGGGPPVDVGVTLSGGSFTLQSKDLDSGGLGKAFPLVVTAKSLEGGEGTGTLELGSFPVPGWLGSAFGSVTYEPTRVKIPFKIAFPAKPWEAKLTFPDYGFMGPLRGKSVGLGKTQVTYETNVRTDCSADDSLTGGTSFDAVFGSVGGSVRGKLDYLLSPKTGFQLTRGTIGFTLIGTVKNEVLLVFAFPALIPYCPILGETICNIVKLETELSVSAAPDFAFKYALDTFTFEDFTELVKLGGKATVSARVGPFSAKVFGGISFGFTVGPETPATPAYGGILRKVEGGVEIGLTITASLFTLVDLKGTGTCSFTPAIPLTCVGTSPVGRAPLLGAPFAVAPLPIHRSEPRAPFADGDVSDVLVSDVSPLASPVSARLPDGRLLLAFVNENASMSNALQRTDVWTALQGVDPAPLAADDRQDLDPALAARPDGSAVLVHSRIKNAGLSNADVKTSADLPRLYRETEVVASLLDASRGVWSTPQALTDNAVLDRGARVVALENGHALAVWLREPANEPASEGAQIVARELIGSTWGAETVVASSLSGVSGIEAASHGSEAIVVFARGGAGIATATFSGGAWSPVRDLTTAATDRTPRVAYGPDGKPRILWLSGEELVWQTPGGPRQSVRGAGSALGLIDARLVASPSGRFAIVWASPGSAGSTTDLLARFFDPGTGTWSEDVLLARDARAMSSLDGFFDAEGRLHVVGLATAIAYEKVERTIDGKKVVLDGIPVEGRSDLVHLTFAPVVDLAAEGPITVSNPQPAPGDTVTATARVTNRGLLPVAGAEVALDDASGGRLATATLDLRPGESRDVAIPFTCTTGARDVVLGVKAPGDVDPTDDTLRYLFANQRPVACLQSTAAGGPAPLTIGFDGGCSSDRDGRVAAYSWSFGDGTRDEGAATSHSFPAAGTYPISLTVTDDVGATGTLLRTIVVGASTGDPRATPSPDHVSLPVVVKAPGVAGTRFVSDATLFNRDRDRDLVVRGLYVPDGRSDTFTLDLRIPPRQTRTLSDVVANGFGAPSGAGWVRLDLDQPNALVGSRTYNDQPEGTAGLAVPGVLDAEAMTTGERRVFPQLWRSGYRVNIAFTNLAGSSSTVTAVAFDAKGAEIGRKSYLVPPYSRLQDNGAPPFQGAGRLEVTMDGGKVVPFVTTVDNATGDAVYETGTTVTPGATSLLIPGVVRSKGANETDFRTDLRIHSPIAQRAELTLSLPSGTIARSLDFSAGETRAYDDVLTGLFPEATGDLSGILFVKAPGPVVAVARTYNLTRSGTYGVSVPARREGELLSPGDTADLIQLENDTDYRCNFAFAAFDPAGATVNVRAFDPRGNLLAARAYSVAGGQSRQISRIFEDLGIETPLPSARLEMSVIGGGRVYAYATVVDNRTGDGTFVEARR